MRVGIGYDVHQLVKDRKLIVGGVEIKNKENLGLLGHSDADVLLHAIMDAILGALAMDDIGKNFPDSDEKYKGASSMDLLKMVKDRMDARGYKIGNIDSTIIAQKPKMSPHIYNMRKNIAWVLRTEIDNVSVKATTEEELGFTGSMEGIKAESIVLLAKK